MKKTAAVIILLLMIFLPCVLYPQELSSLTFLHAVGQKETVTNGDAVFFFMIALNEDPGGFHMNIITLRERGVLGEGYYDRDAPLTRGLLALMAATHLKLRGSFMFLIFGTERYAVRACAAEGIMKSGVSEWDRISGSELIEIMAHVSGARE